MKTVKGKVFPRMNSQIAATFIAIPPKKYHDPETLTMEVLFEPLNSRKQNMVHEYGTRKPRTPSRVGLPARTRRWSVQVFLRNGIVGAQAFLPESTYRVFWRGHPWPLWAGRKVSRIAQERGRE